MRAETNQFAEPEYDPNAGGVGYLTWDQFDRLTRAVNDARSHVPWWRVAGHIRVGDEDEARSRSSDHTIPLPATWLAAEEISRLLGELNRWQTLEQAVNTLEGQFFAELLTREVETAMAKWPMEDKPHKVRYLRCRVCQQQSLKYYPPRAGGGDITVKCTDATCKAVEDPRMFERDALLIRLEAERAADKRVDSSRGRTRKGRQIESDDLSVGEGTAGEDDPTEAEAVAVSA